MTQPINRAHRADDEDLGGGPHSRDRMLQVTPIVPAQRERQDCEQHRNGAQEIDGPEATAIAVAIVYGARVKHEVGGSESLDEGQQPLRGSGALRRRRNLQSSSDQQHPLNQLVERHARATSGFHK